MDHNLSVEESLRFGWEKTRAHSAVLFQSLLTFFAFEIAIQIVSRVLGDTLEGTVAVAGLALGVLIVSAGFTLIVLHIAKHTHAEYKNIFPPVKTWVPYILASFLVAIVSVVPLILARTLYFLAYLLLPYSAALVVGVIVAVVGVVAAVYFMLRYSLVRFAILEDTEVLKSLRTSAQLTRGHKWWLFGFLLMILILNLLGMMLLLIGLLVTVPVTTIAYAHVYATLHARHHASH